MLVSLICLCLLVMSCGGIPPTRQPPTPASLPSVDPQLALIDLDPKRYPELPNHYAITVDGVRLHLLSDRRFKRSAQDAMTSQTGATRYAEEQRDEALKEAAQNAWLAKYGVWIGFGGAVVLGGLTVGGVMLLKR